MRIDSWKDAFPAEFIEPVHALIARFEIPFYSAEADWK